MIKIGDKYKIINANEMCIHQKHNGKIAEVVNKDRYGSFGIIIDNGLHVDYSIDDYMVTQGHVELVNERRMIKIGDKYEIIDADGMGMNPIHDGKIAEVFNKDRCGSFGIIIDNGPHVRYSIDDYMVGTGKVKLVEEVKPSNEPLDFNSQVMLTIDDHYTEFRDSTWQGLLEHFLDALGEAGFMYDESHLRRKKAILSIANTGKIEI